MNNKVSIFLCSIFNFGKWIYLLASLMLVLSVVISIYRIYLNGFTEDSIYGLFSLISVSVLYYFVYRFFLFILLSYDLWMKGSLRDTAFIKSLMSAAKSLFVIAFIEAVAVIGQAYSQLNSEIKSQSYENGILIQMLNLSDNNKVVINELFNYAVPRPSGLLAILIALILIQIVRVQEN